MSDQIPQIAPDFRAIQAIPSAGRDGRICPSPNVRLQVTGRDTKGRKQYRYRQRRRHGRGETKYERLTALGRALPAIRARVERDPKREGLPRGRSEGGSIKGTRM